MATTKAEKPRCCVEVQEPISRNFHPCSRRGSVERDGKHYCRQHDPVARRDRYAADVAKIQAIWAANDIAAERRSAESAACEGVATEDLRPGLLAELIAERTAKS